MIYFLEQLRVSYADYPNSMLQRVDLLISEGEPSFSCDRDLAQVPKEETFADLVAAILNTNRKS